MDNNWFGNRMADAWNNLLNNIIDVYTLDTMKRRLDRHITGEG